MFFCLISSTSCLDFGNRNKTDPDASSPQGTETGNPNIYNQEEFGLTLEYPSGWVVLERGPASAAEPIKNPVTGETIDVGSLSENYLASGTLPTSEASTTVLTDGQSVSTVYYITLEETPDTLLDYLATVLGPKAGGVASETFPEFSNPHSTGREYVNSKPGIKGGELKEYFFLKERTLFYFAAEILPQKEADLKFQQIINSVRFP
ncbi:MAG: hypothetical protein HY542_07175 [Deltaproteobacteria bacterium]|nr:hypothetical protein [Deltaproteobacteria bacterium]